MNKKKMNDKNELDKTNGDISLLENAIQFFMPMEHVPTTTYQNKGIHVVDGKAYTYEREETKQAREYITQYLLKYGIQPFTKNMNDKYCGGDLIFKFSHNHPIFPKGVPLSLSVKWCFEIKENGNNREGHHYEGEYRISKPDTDNLQKMLKDCMTSLGFWYDDAQVCEEHIGKYWSNTPGIFIQVVSLMNDNLK